VKGGSLTWNPTLRLAGGPGGARSAGFIMIASHKYVQQLSLTRSEGRGRDAVVVETVVMMEGDLWDDI